MRARKASPTVLAAVRAWLSMLLVAFVAGACIAELPTPTDRTVDGRYALRTVEGKALPFSQIVQGGVETLHSGFIEFGGAEQILFTVELNYTFEQADLSNDEVILRRGLWMQYDDELLLTYTGSRDSDVARVDRNQISLSTSVVSSSRGKIVLDDQVTRRCIEGCDWNFVFAK